MADPRKAHDYYVDLGMRSVLVEDGLDASDITSSEIHSVFVLTDPDGYRIVVYDDHTVGPV